jgi:hypothetical protein
VIRKSQIINQQSSILKGSPMTTEAQIEANRANAQKSTGPRTPEGKAVVAQNAVKHGLLARTAVLHGEDWEHYTCFSEELMDELYPDGVMEQELADRIVDLSWRLRRAALSQNAVFEALYDQYVAEHGDEPLPEHGPEEGRPPVGTPLLGRMMVADFQGDRVLERMLGYERRIESSLYRTRADFHKLQAERREKNRGLRPSAGSSLPDDHPIWGRPPKRWPPPASPGAAGSDQLKDIFDDTDLMLGKPRGSDAMDLPQDQGQSCQTKPICGQVLGSQEVTNDSPQGEAGQARPDAAGYRPVHGVGRPAVRS